MKTLEEEDRSLNPPFSWNKVRENQGGNQCFDQSTGKRGQAEERGGHERRRPKCDQRI